MRATGLFSMTTLPSGRHVRAGEEFIDARLSPTSANLAATKDLAKFFFQFKLLSKQVLSVPLTRTMKKSTRTLKHSTTSRGTDRKSVLVTYLVFCLSLTVL